MTADDLCRKKAEGQLGLLAVAQALETGLTYSGVRHRIDKGIFVRGLPGILRLAGAPRTYKQRRLEALMWAGDGAALSHKSAALAWRLDPIQAKAVELTSPRDLRHAPRGIVVHIGRLARRDVGRLDGLRVTSPARTLVDLASVVDEESLEIALDCALCRRMAIVERIEKCLDEIGRQGRTGSACLHRLLELRAVGAPLGMSPLEIRFLRLLRKARVTQPESQYEVRISQRRYVLDYAYPDEGVAVELDGYRWHSSPDRLVSDRRKSNAVILAGWTLLRFTDLDVKERPAEVIASVLAARGHRKLWDNASP